MAFSIAEALGPLLSLVIAGLFSGTVVYLARLHRRLGALRGAQSELHGLLRACSDNVDATERSIAALRGVAQTLAADLGRSLDRAEALKAEIDTTCAAADRLLSRLAEEPAVAEMRYAPAKPTHPRRLVARLAAEDGARTPPSPLAEHRSAEARTIPSPLEGEGGARPERSAGWEGEGSGSTGLHHPSPSHASHGPLPLPQGERGFQPVEPRWSERLRPPEPTADPLPDPPGERAALRLFRDTIRSL